MNGLIFRSDASLAHDTGQHPERVQRIIAVEHALAENDWCGYQVRDAPPATEETIELAHSRRYVELVRAACAASEPLDPDTPVVPASFEAALMAAGGACAVVDALCGGEADVAASLARPPGHHAEADRGMGFCLFNSVAVAASHALNRHRLDRVLILDWDVHHGNGTEAIFLDDPRVCFISIHQSPCYPGTGPSMQSGVGAGAGYTVNCPVPPGSGDDVFVGLVRQLVDPLIARFRPQLILLSAGFDAHIDDPLADCEVTDEGFAAMASALTRAAGREHVPIGLVLEGGYDADALSRSLVLTLDQLAGRADSPIFGGASSELASAAAAEVLSRPVFSD